MCLPALVQRNTTVPGLDPGVAVTLLMADGFFVAASAGGGGISSPATISRPADEGGEAARTHGTPRGKAARTVDAIPEVCTRQCNDVTLVDAPIETQSSRKCCHPPHGRSARRIRCKTARSGMRVWRCSGGHMTYVRADDSASRRRGRRGLAASAAAATHRTARPSTPCPIQGPDSLGGWRWPWASCVRTLLPLVSIVVPVHGVEDYIAECLDTLCAQTHDNLQIILVDDGSPDQSIDIMRAYARRDARIEIFRRPPLGPGAARNAGVREARGTYLMFVDPDDVLDRRRRRHPRRVPAANGIRLLGGALPATESGRHPVGRVVDPAGARPPDGRTSLAEHPRSR